MCREKALLQLTGLIYEAAGDPSRWPTFLAELGKNLNAPTVNFAVQELVRADEKNNFDLGSVGLDPGYYRAYTEYYGARNPVITRGGQVMQEGRVYRDDELCPRQELYRTEFYNDWIAPQRMSHALFGIVLKAKRLVAFTNPVRYEGARPFSEEDLDLLRQLNSHLQKAVQLHLRILDLQSRQEAAAEALDRWRLGFILLSGKGEVVFMNRSAEAILKQDDGLLLHGNGLRAATLPDALLLRKLTAGATGTALQPALDLEPGGAMALSRPSGKRPLELLVTPACQNRWLELERGAAAIVFVSDHEEAEEADTALLRCLYGLSRAEAEFASLLLQGKEIKEITGELHISRNTAKTHVSHLLQKTGTRRQSELLRLLLRGPASLRPHRPVALAPLRKRQAS